MEKWIPLSHWSFDQIKQDPLHDLEAVKTYRDIMFCDNEVNHCIMLLDDFGSDGILVESEGYDYPRYRRVREYEAEQGIAEPTSA
ncbi:MAG: hypothetical protein IKH78_03375 [Ruminococcus sp.]|nr:hypothetical protein [Ruminococcus sp.]